MSVDDHGLETLKKSAEEIGRGKAEYKHRVDASNLLELRQDSSQTSRTIYGRALPGTSQTASTWQIWATDISGFITHTQWANNDNRFVHQWSNRNNLFPALAFTNNFATNFSGDTNDYGIVPHSASIDFNQNSGFSISAWVKSSSASLMNIMEKTASGAGYTLEISSSGLVRFEFRATGLGDRLNVRTINSINSGTWRHLIIKKTAGVTAASSVKIYIDGVLQTLTVLNDTLVNSPANIGNLYIAANASGGARFMGLFDEIAMWNAELTESEVLEIYNGNNGVTNLLTGSGQIASALVSWWRMGDGVTSFPTIPDAKSTNNMTLQAGMVSGDFYTETPP